MIAEVQQGLQRRADPEKKMWWENYVKGATFRGTPMAEIRKVVGAAVGDHRELSEVELSKARPGDVRALLADHAEDMLSEARRAASSRL